MPVSIGSTPSVGSLIPPLVPSVVPSLGTPAAREPDAGFQAAKARTSDLVEKAKRDAERRPLAVTDPVEVESAVASASDTIKKKLEEAREESGPQLPGRGGSGGRVDIRV